VFGLLGVACLLWSVLASPKVRGATLGDLGSPSSA
jgi:hypothetical protein